MRKALAPIVAALFAVAFGATSAAAQIDVNLAFTPDTASPGQSVTFLGSVANLGPDPVVADLALTIGVGPFRIGPLPGRLRLPAGAERSIERKFVVPPIPVSGTLTLTLTATAGSSTDTATASLTITHNAMAGSPETALRAFGTDVLTALGAGPTATGRTTLSGIRSLYR